MADPKAPAEAQSAFRELLPPSHWQQPENITKGEDSGSIFTDDTHSSQASITSSILQYRQIHGRTFHNNDRMDADYWGPNDQKNSEVLDMLHHVNAMLLGGKLHLAPLDSSKLRKALDVGTGTGMWAIDFADEYPEVEVTGTDISPIQPDFIPPNLHFEIDDCTLPWAFGPDKFDFIHIRWLIGGIVDWTKLFREAYDTLTPGGWLESHETESTFTSDDGSVHDKTAVSQWGKIFRAASLESGRSFSIVSDGVQEIAMEAAGLQNIQSRVLKTPIGDWPTDSQEKQIGIFAALALDKDMEGFLIYTLSKAGWKLEEIMGYTAQLRREIRSDKIKAHYNQKVVWGQKPLGNV